MGLACGSSDRTMIKLARMIAVASVAALVAHCSGANPYFVKKPAEIKTGIKKIVVLPIYLDKEFFPLLPHQADDRRYDDMHKKSIETALKTKLTIMESVVTEALSKGAYRFEVQAGAAKDLNVAGVSRASSEFYREQGEATSQSWPYNYVYSLSPETIAKLAAKYNADGVLFQYLQVHKVWESVKWQSGNYRFAIYMPLDTIVYVPQLYSKDGTLLYGGARKGRSIFSGVSFYENKNGDALVRLEKGMQTAEGKNLAMPVELPASLNVINVQATREYFVERFTGVGGSLYGLYAE